MSGITFNPHVGRAVDLLTEAVIAAAHEARTSERYIHSDAGVDRALLDATLDAARAAQVAAQNAIYDLAEAVASEHQQVAS